MRIAVVGSRTWKDEQMVRKFVQGLDKDTVVVSGGAIGPDRWAVDEAEKLGLKTKVFLPDWTKGKAAGFIRNTVVVDYAERIVAFWDGESKGTSSTIHLARAARKPVTIYRKTSTESSW